jgi:hypothetical protein
MRLYRVDVNGDVTPDVTCQHSLRRAALACVVALAQTARHGETFAGYPTGLIRCEKHSD